MNKRDTPLAGIRVIELSHVLAGPICGLMLAYLGAEVIKIERPGKGDGQRWNVSSDDKLGTDSASLFMITRSKDSITLDLKSDEGKQQLWQLIDTADCIVENYRVGILDKLGFGYEEALLHKAVDGRISSPYPGRTYPMISVTGMPSVV